MICILSCTAYDLLVIMYPSVIMYLFRTWITLKRTSNLVIGKVLVLCCLAAKGVKFNRNTPQGCREKLKVSVDIDCQDLQAVVTNAKIIITSTTSFSDLFICF